MKTQGLAEELELFSCYAENEEKLCKHLLPSAYTISLKEQGHATKPNCYPELHLQLLKQLHDYLKLSD